MQRTQAMILMRRPARLCAGFLAGALWVTGSFAAEPTKPSAQAEAGAIETRLIDLQVQAGVLMSLQGNAQPVDTGVLAERQTTALAPSRQGADQLGRIGDEIRRLTKRYRKLTGQGAGILPQGAQSRRVAASTLVARAPEPAVSPSPTTAGSGAGGWGGTTTVSPGYGTAGGAALSPDQSATGGWGTAADSQGSTNYGAGAYGGQAGAAQPSTGTTSGWGDTSGGRVGEVLPPGVPYPGAGNESYSQALAGLDQARRQPAPQVAPGSTPGAGVVTGSDLQGAEAAYEQAYGHLLQQDYGAAQYGFRDFLTRYRGSALAGNAQYWLGEIHYVQGQYKEAARAFLTGYEQYGNGNKAADSLFKLAMSLDKLNQAKAACSSLSEFFKRYGQAGDAPVEQASEARQRLRCRS